VQTWQRIKAPLERVTSRVDAVVMTIFVSHAFIPAVVTLAFVVEQQP
jgi:hypothetical protein